GGHRAADAAGAARAPAAPAAPTHGGAAGGGGAAAGGVSADTGGAAGASAVVYVKCVGAWFLPAEGPHAILLLPPDVLALPLRHLRPGPRLRLGLAVQFALRPREGPHALSGIHRHARLRRRAGLRRHMRQRAPPDGLWPHA